MSLMNKNEQAQLCMLLAKLRYDLMEFGAKTWYKDDEYIDLVDAINKIMAFSYLDGKEVHLVDENKNTK